MIQAPRKTKDSPSNGARAYILPTTSEVVFVRYRDHLMFHRGAAETLNVAIRETLGWLVYECDDYITVTNNKDAKPPTVKGEDPKASGIVVLRETILTFVRLQPTIRQVDLDLGNILGFAPDALSQIKF